MRSYARAASMVASNEYAQVAISAAPLQTLTAPRQTQGAIVWWQGASHVPPCGHWTVKSTIGCGDPVSPLREFVSSVRNTKPAAGENAFCKTANLRHAVRRS